MIHRDAAIRLFRSTGGRCSYCGVKCWPAAPNRSEMTIDHLVPRVEGGTDDLANLVPSCKPCNSAKGHRSVESLRHSRAIAHLGWPNFSREQIAWMRQRGFDLSAYDGYQFWFERRRTKTRTAGRVHSDKPLQMSVLAD